MTLRNRLVMSPMETMYGTPDGLPSERTARLLRRPRRGRRRPDHRRRDRASTTSTPRRRADCTSAPTRAVDAHRALVEAVHEHGAKIQPQIVHAGPDGLGPEMHGVTSIGPSVIPSYLTGRPSAEITHEQLGRGARPVQGGGAARRARPGTTASSCTPRTATCCSARSWRRSATGAPTTTAATPSKGRIRVVLEALAAIRSEVGDDLPITLRISGYERVAGGRPMYETAQVAPQLVAAGVDAFHVSGGVIDRLVTGMVNAADDGDGLNVGAAAAVKQVVDVPVIAVGRIHDPSAGRADPGRRARRLHRDGPPDAGRPRAAEQARIRAVRPGPQVHLVRELHRRHGTTILGGLRGQPAHRQGARTGGAPARRAASGSS